MNENAGFYLDQFKNISKVINSPFVSKFGGLIDWYKNCFVVEGDPKIQFRGRCSPRSQCAYTLSVNETSHESKTFFITCTNSKCLGYNTTKPYEYLNSLVYADNDVLIFKVVQEFHLFSKYKNGTWHMPTYKETFEALQNVPEWKQQLFEILFGNESVEVIKNGINWRLKSLIFLIRIEHNSCEDFLPFVYMLLKLETSEPKKFYNFFEEYYFMRERQRCKDAIKDLVNEISSRKHFLQQMKSVIAFYYSTFHEKSSSDNGCNKTKDPDGDRFKGYLMFKTTIAIENSNRRILMSGDFPKIFDDLFSYIIVNVLKINHAEVTMIYEESRKSKLTVTFDMIKQNIQPDDSSDSCKIWLFGMYSQGTMQGAQIEEKDQKKIDNYLGHKRCVSFLHPSSIFVVLKFQRSEFPFPASKDTKINETEPKISCGPGKNGRNAKPQK